MSVNNTPRLLRIISIVLLFIIGLNALAAGYSFMVEPTGKDLGISIEYLRYSPFEDFFIPGMVLFFANGVLSILTAVITIKQWRYYRELLVIQGCILFGWIVIQVFMLRDFNLLHAVCSAAGIILITIGWKLRQKVLMADTA
jgi:hypothetical protein